MHGKLSKATIIKLFPNSRLEKIKLIAYLSRDFDVVGIIIYRHNAELVVNRFLQEY